MELSGPGARKSGVRRLGSANLVSIAESVDILWEEEEGRALHYGCLFQHRFVLKPSLFSLV